MTASTFLFAVGWTLVVAAVLLLLAEETLYRMQSIMNRTVRLDDWVLRHRRKAAVVCLAIATYILSSGVAHAQRGSAGIVAQRSVDRSGEIAHHFERQQALIAQILEQVKTQPGAEGDTIATQGI